MLAYETTDPDDHGGGLHLLYADGTVDWVTGRSNNADLPEYARFLADVKAGVEPLKWTRDK